MGLKKKVVQAQRAPTLMSTGDTGPRRDGPPSTPGLVTPAGHPPHGNGRGSPVPAREGRGDATTCLYPDIDRGHRFPKEQARLPSTTRRAAAWTLEEAPSTPMIGGAGAPVRSLPQRSQRTRRTATAGITGRRRPEAAPATARRQRRKINWACLQLFTCIPPFSVVSVFSVVKCPPRPPMRCVRACRKSSTCGIG